MFEIELAGRPLVLLADKAAFLPGENCLLIADAHVGKAVSFRKLGVPVPRGTTTDALERVSALIAATGASRVAFLGDFLHSERSHANSTLGALTRWRHEQPSLRLTLVRGNHDDRAGDPPSTLGFEVVDEPLPLGGFALCHHPRAIPGAYVLAGHWHPCISVGGRALDRLRLPCFWFRESVGVLPAFGDFTGMHPIQRAPADRVYAVADGRVVALP
jgi:DNA ligase-associated metallophosphoesterase